MASDRVDNDKVEVKVEQTHALDEVHEALTGHGADRHEIPSGSALVGQVEDWNKQFDTLPQTTDGQGQTVLDTQKFSEDNWKTAQDMFNRLNGPDGEIAKWTGIRDQKSGNVDSAMTNLNFSEVQPAN